MNTLDGVQRGTRSGVETQRSRDFASAPSPDSFSASLARAVGTLPAAPVAIAAIRSGVLGPAFSPRTSSHVRGEPSLNERALALRAYRQELLASNMANADTPKYKAVDIDVEDALRHGKTVATVEVQHPVSAQPSIDGNTVDMDTERGKFASNTIGYRYSLDRVGGHFKEITELLNNIR